VPLTFLSLATKPRTATTTAVMAVCQLTSPFDQLILEYVPAHDPHQGWVHVSHAAKLRKEAFSVIARGHSVPGLHYKL